MQEQGKKQQQKQNNEFLGTMQQCGQRGQYHNLVDILFVIDTTGSMGWCISQLKKTVCKIMKKFSDKQYNIKFAIQVYRDHPPQEYSFVEKHFDLRNQDAIIKVIDQECDVAGGGDTPEAVFDGLVNGLKKTSWRMGTDGKTRSKRFLFHGCDAPPHGKQYGSSSSVPQWNQKGCPCGYTRHDVKKLLEQNHVDYSIIKCGNQADVMAGLFKQCFADKFKRELQIKHETKSYKSKGKSGARFRSLQRKRSVEYIEQIQRQEMQGSASSGSDSSSQQQVRSDISEQRACIKQISLSPRLYVDECDEPFASDDRQYVQKQVLRECAYIEKSVQADKQKVVKKKKVKKEKKQKKQKKDKKKQKSIQEQYANSSDQQKGGRQRSMASLVLSDVEDGIQNYFQEPKKSTQEKTEAKVQTTQQVKKE